MKAAANHWSLKAQPGIRHPAWPRFRRTRGCTPLSCSRQANSAVPLTVRLLGKEERPSAHFARPAGLP